MTQRQIDFDRFLIDWADEFIQDLVASFSARRPTMTLRLVVVGFYVLAALHLVSAVILPFYRDVIGAAIGAGAPSRPPSTQFMALVTSIVVGGVSFHLLLTLAYVLLSFVVRAARRWTRLAGTVVLGVNVAITLNTLRIPTTALNLFFVLQWITLVCSGGVIALLGASALAPAAVTAALPTPKGHFSNGRA